MDADEFARWLQGYAELQGDPPTQRQWDCIKDHLQLVFDKVTPSLADHFRMQPKKRRTAGLGVRLC